MSALRDPIGGFYRRLGPCHSADGYFIVQWYGMYLCTGKGEGLARLVGFLMIQS